MKGPFKMKGSPMQRNFGIGDKKTKKKGEFKRIAKQLGHAVKYTFTDIPKHLWKKHGPVINPSTKNPKGIGK